MNIKAILKTRKSIFSMSEEAKQETNLRSEEQVESIYDTDGNNKNKNAADNPDPLTHPEFVIDLNTKYDEDLVKQLQEEEGFVEKN